LEGIRNNITSFVDEYNFNPDIYIDEMKMLEVQRLAKNIISKPYKDWMYKEKTKIRYYIAEDAKRTWNRIKQPAGHATKIPPDVFADHYSQNWEIQPAKIRIDECSDFIMQRKLVLSESDMMKELLNKNKMRDAITKKRICQLQALIN
jgi:hypothetical protein